MDSDNTEVDMVKSLWYKFLISLVITILIMLVMKIGHHYPDLYKFNSISQLLLATLTIVWPGRFIFQYAYESIISRELDMFTLIAIGVSAAWIFSLLAMLFPHYLPQEMLTKDGHPELYFESSAMLISFIILGQVLEAKALKKTGHAIKSLMQLQASSAEIVLDNNETKSVPISEIKLNAVVRIKPGNQIPVDGLIISGGGSVDESMISGESVAREKNIDDKVFAGTLNKFGSFDVKVTALGGETLLNKIISLVETAQSSRTKFQNTVDKISEIFVPSVIAFAILTFVFWSMFMHNYNMALITFVCILLAACPCALGMATPIAVVVGSGLGAKNGILIKKAEYIELLKSTNIIVFDKTGTLTTGDTKVANIITFDNYNSDSLLQKVASIEKFSEHPLALGIIKYAKEKNLTLLDVKNFQAIPGGGIVGEVEGEKFLIGTEDFLVKNEIDCSILTDNKSSQSYGGSIICVAKNQNLIGLIILSDQIKNDAVEVIKQLKELGITPVLLTGDNLNNAQVVASVVNIKTIYANSTPELKFEIIKKLQAEGKIVTMVGDGINDVAALAQANVGIAMSNGSNAALENADITLLNGELSSVIKAINLSRVISKNIKENLFFAFIYNLLILPIAAGVLYPEFNIIFNPIYGSIAMSLSSVSVITNALRMRSAKLVSFKQ